MNVLPIGMVRRSEKQLRVLGELGCQVWVADMSAEQRTFAEKAGISEARSLAEFRAALPHVDAVDLVTPARAASSSSC